MNRVNVKWTKDEFALAMMGFRKFGQNFKAIAELLGTKTESHVRKFFVKYRKSRDLDSVCRESQKGNEGAKQSIEIMEVVTGRDFPSHLVNPFHPLLPHRLNLTMTFSR